MIQCNVIDNVHPSTLVWENGNLVDWSSSGKILFSLHGEEGNKGIYGFAYKFDSCITSQNGEYKFLYEKLGVKGLLLDKNGEIIREINRSYYYANTYEYPAAFITIEGKTYLAHCPLSYCQLDFEEVETGEIITISKERNPADFFHSRLEVSSDNTKLLSRGWVWQPIEYVQIYPIAECLNNPLLLDGFSYQYPQANSNITTADFIDSDKVLLGCADMQEIFDEEERSLLTAGQISIWNVETNKMEKIIPVKGEFGNIFAINKTYIWDFYKYPKIIQLETGKVVAELSEVNSGEQNSSIIQHLKEMPLLSVNKEYAAIYINTKLYILKAEI